MSRGHIGLGGLGSIDFSRGTANWQHLPWLKEPVEKLLKRFYLIYMLSRLSITGYRDGNGM